MIVLAHDGAFNGDWLSHYAIQLARHAADRSLRLAHVTDPASSRADIEARLAPIAGAAEAAGLRVEVDIRQATPRRGVFATLLDALPTGPQHLVVCGTRVKPRARRLLGGTISERLLRQRARRVLAVRVVNPGQLGVPHHLLVPLAGHPRGLRLAWPFLELLLPAAAAVTLLQIRPPARRLGGPVNHEERAAAREAGLGYLGAIAEELRARATADLRIEQLVAIADDWAPELLVQASALKAQLILLGASEQRLRAAAARRRLETVLRRAPCDVAVYRGV